MKRSEYSPVEVWDLKSVPAYAVVEVSSGRRVSLRLMDHDHAVVLCERLNRMVLSGHPGSPVATASTARASRDQVEHNEFAQSEGG